MSFNNYLLMDEEKFKKEEEDIFNIIASNRKEFVIWAKDNNKFYDTNIYTSEKIFSVATKYLINDNYGNYNDDDIKYLIYYFSKKLFNDLDIRGVKTDISYGKFYTDYASSYYNYEDGIITFFMDSFKCLKGNNPDLLNGLMLIYHDIYRVSQENAIRNKKNNFDFIDYAIAMETINVYNTNGFYYNNYELLFL